MRGLLNSFVRDQFLPSTKSLSVAFVYEDGETHRQATGVHEFLVQELEENAELTASWWRTSLLGDPKLARAAARSIAASDFIILSVLGRSNPSLTVQSWIESWPLQNGGPVKLVALLQSVGEGRESRSQWDAYLRAFAIRRNLLYLPGSLVGTEPHPAIVHEADEVVTPWSMPPSETPIEPYLHWGLNE
jgi:hypothetical protein